MYAITLYGSEATTITKKVQIVMSRENVVSTGVRMAQKTHMRTARAQASLRDGAPVEKNASR